jgi:hypothetical protein
VHVEGGAEVEVEDGGDGPMVAFPQGIAQLVGLEGQGVRHVGEGVEPDPIRITRYPDFVEGGGFDRGQGGGLRGAGDSGMGHSGVGGRFVPHPPAPAPVVVVVLIRRRGSSDLHALPSFPSARALPPFPSAPPSLPPSPLRHHLDLHRLPRRIQVGRVRLFQHLHVRIVVGVALLTSDPPVGGREGDGVLPEAVKDRARGLILP